MTKSSPPTADLVDDFEDIVTACTTQFRDFGGRKRFSGPIRTVTCRNDNQLIKDLMGEPGNAAVLVVEQEQRERAVQHSVAVMGVGLGDEACLVVVAIDEDELFTLGGDDSVLVVHGLAPPSSNSVW